MGDLPGCVFSKLSTFTKKNNLSLIIGPPNVNPNVSSSYSPVVGLKPSTVSPLKLSS